MVKRCQFNEHKLTNVWFLKKKKHTFNGYIYDQCKSTRFPRVKNRLFFSFAEVEDWCCRPWRLVLWSKFAPYCISEADIFLFKWEFWFIGNTSIKSRITVIVYITVKRDNSRLARSSHCVKPEKVIEIPLIFAWVTK